MDKFTLQVKHNTKNGMCAASMYLPQLVAVGLWGSGVARGLSKRPGRGWLPS